MSVSALRASFCDRNTPIAGLELGGRQLLDGRDFGGARILNHPQREASRPHFRRRLQTGRSARMSSASRSSAPSSPAVSLPIDAAHLARRA